MFTDRVERGSAAAAIAPQPVIPAQIGYPALAQHSGGEARDGRARSAGAFAVYGGGAGRRPRVSRERDRRRIHSGSGRNRCEFAGYLAVRIAGLESRDSIAGNGQSIS